MITIIIVIITMNRVVYNLYHCYELCSLLRLECFSSYYAKQKIKCAGSQVNLFVRIQSAYAQIDMLYI